jgi:hypothetical protein
MPQYVLKHGGLSMGKSAPGVPTLPSADPLKPTIIEMEADEAAKINYSPGVLLEGSKGHPAPLQLLSEYQAELAGEKAKAKAVAEVKAAAKVDEKPKAEEKKGGKP